MTSFARILSAGYQPQNVCVRLGKLRWGVPVINDPVAANDHRAPPSPFGHCSGGTVVSTVTRNLAKRCP